MLLRSNPLRNTAVIAPAEAYSSRGSGMYENKTYARGIPLADALAAERPALGKSRGDLGLPVWPAVLQRSLRLVQTLKMEGGHKSSKYKHSD